MVDESVTLLIPRDKTLFPHQEEDIRRMLFDFRDQKGIVNANEMGLGKTVEMCIALNFLKPSRVLILCSSSGRGVWRAMLEEWLLEVYSGYIHEIKSQKQQVVSVHLKDCMVISSYHLAIHHRIRRQLASIPWDVMIADEADRFGSPKSLTSRMVLGNLYRVSKKAFFLTGSITSNKFSQLWPLFYTLDTENKIPKYWHFVHKYCHVEENQFGKQVRGAKVQEAKKLIAYAKKRFMIRRMKKKVLPNMPKVLYKKVYIEPSAEFKAAKHAQAAADFAAKDFEEIPLNHPEISSLRRELGEAKIESALDFVTEYLERLEHDEPIAVFWWHKEAARRLHTQLMHRYRKEHYGISCITGDSSSDKKTAAVERFQKGEDRILVGTYALSDSVTLTRCAHVVIAEMAFSRRMNEQLVDRFNRIGQTQPVQVSYLLVRDSIDIAVYDSYKRKASEHRRIHDS